MGVKTMWRTDEKARFNARLRLFHWLALGHIQRNASRKTAHSGGFADPQRRGRKKNQKSRGTEFCRVRF
jgi:hypothetical protein